MRFLISLAVAATLLVAPTAGAAPHRIAAVTLSPATLPAGTTGTAYNQTITAGGTATCPCTYAVTGGSLPLGLTLTSAGVLSGTPTSANPYSFTVTATDSLAAQGSLTYGISISPAPVSVLPATLNAASQFVPYSATLSGSGGTGPYTFAVTAGSLPAGMALASGGLLNGSPSGPPNSYSFTVTATDANGAAGLRNYSLSVSVSAPGMTPVLLGSPTAGDFFSTSFVGTLGTAPYTFAVASGSALPPGLSLTSAGVLSGTPSAGGTFTFSLAVTDANGLTSTRSYSMTVQLNQVFVDGGLPSGQYGQAYSTTFGAVGGDSPYVFSLSDGALPAGLTLSSSGILAGTPTASGVFYFTVRARDTYGAMGGTAYALVIVPPQIAIVTGTIFSATSSIFYRTQLIASGGLGPYTFSLVSGKLPAGLWLSAEGLITGVANDVAGLYTVTLKATDAFGASGQTTLSLNLAKPIIIVSSSLPTAKAGSAYKQTLTITGGSYPFTFSLNDGALPAGMSLSTDGDLMGTPTTAGTYLFSVRVADAQGVVGVQSFRLVVDSATPTVVKTPPKKFVVAAPKKKAPKAKVKVKAKAKAKSK